MRNLFENLKSGVARFREPKPTNTKQSRLATKAKGTSGTEIFAGMFDEEDLQKLANDRGIETFDQMRRSDSQVAMLLAVVKNPIKSARWGIVAVDDSDQEKEKAAFVEHLFVS